MICLGCGMDCHCAEPTSFKEWPLQESLAVEDIYALVTALQYSAVPGIANTVNAMRGYLERYEEAIRLEFISLVNSPEEPV